MFSVVCVLYADTDVVPIVVIHQSPQTPDCDHSCTARVSMEQNDVHTREACACYPVAPACTRASAAAPWL